MYLRRRIYGLVEVDAQMAADLTICQLRRSSEHVMESERQVNDRSQKWHLQMSIPLGIHDLR